jgi:hypothetical protein
MPSDSLDLSLSLEKRLPTLSRLRPSTREEVLNVFTPANMITQPAKFAGREDALEQMINALQTQNANLIVFGERGTGKSSLAHMFFDIVNGNLEILDYYGLRERLQSKGLLSWVTGTNNKRFNTVWVDGFGKNLDQLIRSILIRRPESSFGQGLLFYLNKEADKREVTKKLGIDYQAFSAGAEIKEEFSTDKPETSKEAFEMATQRYANEYGEELIILVDEFETVDGGAEISQYLKSTRGARFVLIGIAEQVCELVSHHASVAREAYGIKLSPMSNEELGMILDIGSCLLEGICKLRDDAKDEIVRNSYNSPYWCHLLARTALLEKIKSLGSFEAFRKTAISISEIIKVLESLSTRAETVLYEEILLSTTLGEDILQRILLNIARWPTSPIQSPKLCLQVKETENIPCETTRAAIEDFLKLRSGPFREQGRVLDAVSFVFQDPNFKRYIQIRNAGLAAQTKQASVQQNAAPDGAALVLTDS